jgi:hypothetical protein
VSDKKEGDCLAQTLRNVEEEEEEGDFLAQALWNVREEK